MKRKNISVIVMDTMRLDEFAGLEREHGKFAGLGFNYVDNCIAPSPWTLPSHASLFTGKYPHEHGSHETKEIKSLDIARIRLRGDTVVDDLSGLGYHTYGVSANPYVHPIYGFERFGSFREESYFTDIYGSVFEVSEKVKVKVARYRNAYGTSSMRLASGILREDPNLFFEALGSAAVHTPRSAAKKLKAKLIDGWPIEKGGRGTVKYLKDAVLREPYFLFVNLMEAHDPYIGRKGKDMNWATPFLKEGPDRETLRKWKSLYSTGAAKAYGYAHSIASGLLERYGEDQLIIVTSDHGQEFNEHGFIGHGVMLHDEIIRVPMMAHGIQGRGGKGFSSLVNVRRLADSYAMKGKADASLMSCATARSESFGVPANITMVPGIDRAKLRRAERVTTRTFGSQHGSHA